MKSTPHINNLIVFFTFLLSILAIPFPALSDSNNGLIARVTRLENQMAQLQYHIVPVGSILPFAGPIDELKDIKPPEGWLLCDGRELDGNTDEYQSLFLVIGTCWGAGNGTPQNFNLPDLRGQFLRGVDHGAKVDPKTTDKDRMALHQGGNTGDQVGSYQKDASTKHRHQIGDVVGKRDIFTGRLRFYDSGGIPHDVLVPAIQKQIHGGGGAHDDFKELKSDTRLFSAYANATGEDETRPKNVYVNWIIKYKSTSDLFSFYKYQ